MAGNGSGLLEVGVVGEAQGPVPFNIHPVLYNVNSDCLIRSPGGPRHTGTRDEVCCNFFFLLLIDLQFYY